MDVRWTNGNWSRLGVWTDLKVKTPAVEGWGFVASEGFEPPKSETADLQSDPFGRLGN